MNSAESAPYRDAGRRAHVRRSARLESPGRLLDALARRMGMVVADPEDDGDDP